VVGSSIRDGGDDRTCLMKFAQLTKQKVLLALDAFILVTTPNITQPGLMYITGSLRYVVSGAIKGRMERKRLTSNQLVNRMRTIETFKLSCCAST
jgi:hypothetical protein